MLTKFILGTFLETVVSTTKQGVAFEFKLASTKSTSMKKAVKTAARKNNFFKNWQPISFKIKLSSFVKKKRWPSKSLTNKEKELLVQFSRDIRYRHLK